MAKQRTPKKMDFESIGGRLTVYRTRRGWTVSQLAARSGIPLSTLSDIETGRVTDPRASVLTKLADTLGVGIEALQRPVHKPRKLIDVEPEEWELLWNHREGLGVKRLWSQADPPSREAHRTLIRQKHYTYTPIDELGSHGTLPYFDSAWEQGDNPPPIGTFAILTVKYRAPQDPEQPLVLDRHKGVEALYVMERRDDPHQENDRDKEEDRFVHLYVAPEHPHDVPSGKKCDFKLPTEDEGEKEVYLVQLKPKAFCYLNSMLPHAFTTAKPNETAQLLFFSLQTSTLRSE